MKKFLIVSLIILFVYICHSQMYTYNIEKACKTITEKAETSSRCCCAWYVMRAMHSGGCSIGIYPAWFYKHILPYYGFNKISIENYIPQKGDIVVIENSKEHFWGHIAMYNDNQWISDFKQKKMNPYKKEYNYEIFRYKFGQ